VSELRRSEILYLLFHSLYKTHKKQKKERNFLNISLLLRKCKTKINSVGFNRNIFSKEEKQMDMGNMPVFQNHVNNEMQSQIMRQGVMQEAQDRLWFQNESAKIELQKQAELSAIKVYESEHKAKVCADVATRRKFQCTKILIGKDGTVSLNKEQFGTGVKGKLPVRIIQAKKLMAMGSRRGSGILIIQAESDVGLEFNLIFSPDQLENRFINRQFDRWGISFGFGLKKELEVRRELILYLLREAELIEIPVKHGWYQEQGMWQYALPESTTWKEVSAWL
jgi:hypothetical protein